MEEPSAPGRHGAHAARVVALFRSRAHNFVGHHGMEPGVHPMEAVPWLDCVAGRGVAGDRFFDHRPDYKGQITFFECEVHAAIQDTFGVAVEPWVYRRNVITQGISLSEWIGRTFEVQGILFEGVEECRPCYWMDRVVTAGVEEFMRGRGGLRARILKDGRLCVGALTVSARAACGGQCQGGGPA